MRSARYLGFHPVSADKPTRSIFLNLTSGLDCILDQSGQTPGFAGQHSDYEIDTYYAHIPGLKTVIPSTPTDAKGMMVSAIRDPNPVVFLWADALRPMIEDVPDEQYTTPLDKTAIRARKLPEPGVVVTVSRSHFDQRTGHFLAQFPQAERTACGSSLKFCRVAEGSVDLYPRLAPTHEWDVAAGHAIVAAAGGLVASASGDPLAYGQSTNDFRISDFVAFGGPTAIERISRLTS